MTRKGQVGAESWCWGSPVFSRGACPMPILIHPNFKHPIFFLPPIQSDRVSSPISITLSFESVFSLSASGFSTISQLFKGCCFWGGPSTDTAPPSLHSVITEVHKAVIAGIYHFQVEILPSQIKDRAGMLGAIYNSLLTFHVKKLREVNKHQAINLGTNMIKASELFFERTSS